MGYGKMKIALCLSGHMRKFEQIAPSLRFLPACDVFIHTWDKLGYASNYKTDSALNSTNIDKIKKLYNPAQLVVENSSFINELIAECNQYAPHLIGVPKPLGHMASMFYKIYAANELRKRHEMEAGIKYDWVIRSRPDLLFHGDTRLPEYQTGAVFIPGHLSGGGWLCDQFAISGPDEMDLYASSFFNLKDYFSAKMDYYPEKYLDYCFRTKKLNPIMWDCHFSILR